MLQTPKDMVLTPGSTLKDIDKLMNISFTNRNEQT